MLVGPLDRFWQFFGEFTKTARGKVEKNCEEVFVAIILLVTSLESSEENYETIIKENRSSGFGSRPYQIVWEGAHLAPWEQLRSYMNEKVTPLV
jgi:hypothetical protein